MEAERELEEIYRKANNRGRRIPFSIHTMSDLEKWARRIKIIVSGFGYQPRVLGEMDAVIEISEDYHKRHAGIEDETINQAIRHLLHGIELFLNKDS